MADDYFQGTPPIPIEPLTDPEDVYLLTRWKQAAAQAELLAAELTDAMATARRLREVIERADASERN